MNIKKKKIKLADDTFAYIGRASNLENVNVFKNELSNYIKILNDIIEIDFNKINDKELYILLSKVYDISLDENDFLELLSKCYNKQYNYIGTIKTDMVYTDIKTEGYGNGFSWWRQSNQVNYKAAISGGYKYDYNKIHSKAEIKKLVLEKKIVIFSIETYPIKELKSNFEKYESIPMIDITNDVNSKFIQENYSLFGKLLRKKITKKRVLLDVKKQINDINYDLDTIFKQTPYSSNDYLEIGKLCSDWFVSSNEGKEYQNILKKLWK